MSIIFHMVNLSQDCHANYELHSSNLKYIHSPFSVLFGMSVCPTVPGKLCNFPVHLQLFLLELMRRIILAARHVIASCRRTITCSERGAMAFIVSTTCTSLTSITSVSVHPESP